MLSTPFTRFAPVAFVTLLLTLSACSSKPEQQTETVKQAEMDKTLIDLVKVNPSETVKSSQGAILQGGNRYLLESDIRLANVPAGVLSQFNQAVELIKQGDLSSAEQRLLSLSQQYPQLSGIWVNLALITLTQDMPQATDSASDFSATEKIAKATDYLEKAIEVNPNNPYAWQILANLAKASGDFKRAENSYKQALSIWPNYPEAQLNIAIFYELYQGKWLEAWEYYRAYLKQRPDDETAARYLAGLELKMSRKGIDIPKVSEASQHDNQEKAQ